jgi:hypothetical protein
MSADASLINIVTYCLSKMSEKKEKDDAAKTDKPLKDRPDKKHSIDDYKSEDKDEIIQEKLE